MNWLKIMVAKRLMEFVIEKVIPKIKEKLTRKKKVK